MSESIAPTTLGDNAPDTQGSTESQTTEAATTETTFYAGLNEVNQAYVKDSGYTDMDNVVKSLTEAQKSLSDGSKRIPNADASDEAKAAFHKAMGVPDESSGYDFKMAEGLSESFEYDANVSAAFKDMAKASNLSVDQAQGIHDTWTLMADKAVIEQKAQHEQMMVQSFENSTKSLAEAWGAEGSPEFKANADCAFKGIEGMGGAALRQEMVEAGIITEKNQVLKPELIKAIAKIGERLYSEGKMVTGGTAVGDNPFAKGKENLTAQAEMYKTNRPLYNQLRKTADPMT